MDDDLLKNYARVTADVQCPVCGRYQDGCLIALDGKTAICVREPSDTVWAIGFIHELDKVVTPPPQKKTSKLDPLTVRETAYRLYKAGDDVWLSKWGSYLGVSPDALDTLRAGRTGTAMAFPMRTSEGIVGIRFRGVDGEKWSLRGGREGLFIPSSQLQQDGTTIIVEGPTDTAALLTTGLHAIGRPNCNGGAQHILDWAELYPRRQFIILADNDQVGLKGAEKLAEKLGGRCDKIIKPIFHKDVRDMVQYFIDPDDVAAAIIEEDKTYFEVLAK